MTLTPSTMLHHNIASHTYKVDLTVSHVTIPGRAEYLFTDKMPRKLGYWKCLLDARCSTPSFYFDSGAKLSSSPVCIRFALPFQQDYLRFLSPSFRFYCLHVRHDKLCISAKPSRFHQLGPAGHFPLCE